MHRPHPYAVALRLIAQGNNLSLGPPLDGPYPDRLTFEQDIDQMKQWIRRRLKWLDAEIERRTAAETPVQ